MEEGKKILSYQEFTQKRMEKILEKYKEDLEKTKNTIIKNTNTPLNSVNLLVGPQGSGKTFLAIKEIIKISENLPEAHMMLYINKRGMITDEMFKKYEHMIDMPIMCVAWKNIEEALETLYDYKSMYNDIIEYGLENEVTEEMMQELAENLCVTDFTRRSLQTILYFEDVAKSPILKKEIVTSTLSECRHYNVTCFLLVQYWKSMDTIIKDNAKVVYYFAGYSKRTTQYFLSQVPVERDSKELIIDYNRLPPTGLMRVDVMNRVATFTDRESL